MLQLLLLESPFVIGQACALLFLDPAKVEEGITVKISMAGGQEVRGRWRKADGEMLRGSLSKAMFDKLFDWIVNKLNTNIEPPDGFQVFMGRFFCGC